MDTLKPTFTKYGDTFKQAYRCNDFLIYNRSCDSYDDVYEVFRYKVHKPDKFHDTNYEQYPSDEAFGDWAWCCKGKYQLIACLRLKLDLTPEDALYTANLC